MGYDWNFGKSHGAVDAEMNGRYPASTLAKRLKVKTGAIKSILTPCEWHHTSSFFNRTDFYDEKDAIDRLDELKAWKPPKKKETEEDLGICSGHWTETNPRFHKYTQEFRFKNVRIVLRGNWYRLHYPNGHVKRISYHKRGLFFWNVELENFINGVVEAANAANAANKEDKS